MSELHTPVSAAPVLIYVPAASGIPSTYIFNEGTATVYVGGPSVSTYSGVPLAPNQRMTLQPARGTLYACSGYTGGTVAGSVTTAAVAGATSLSTSASGLASGNIVIDAGTPRQEVASVSANTGGTVTIGALLYGHAVGASVSSITSQASAVHVVSGTV